MTAVSTFDVAVIGLGVMGHAAAYNLARRGKTVIGLEQFEVGHARGSSHGENRAIRMAYAEGAHYVDLLRAAYAEWDDLGDRCGTEILSRVGLVQAGHRGSKMVADVIKAARTCGLPCRTLSADAVAREFPAFRLPDDWDIVVEDNAGYLRADMALAAFGRLAVARGADLRYRSAVTAIEPGADSIVLRLGGAAIEARSVVVTAGAWLGALVPDLKPKLRLTRQSVTWFDPPNPAFFETGFPVFALETKPETIIYGFPHIPGKGLKAASHHLGRTLQRADDLDQDGGPDDSRPIADALDAYVPGAANADPRTRTCLYTNAPDGDFAIGRHPEDPRIVLASPCSGHGFKFAGVLGGILADLATMREPAHDIAKFDIARLFPCDGRVRASAEGACPASQKSGT